MNQFDCHISAFLLLALSILLAGCGSGYQGEGGPLAYASPGASTSAYNAFGRGETIAVGSVVALKMLGTTSKGLEGDMVTTMVPLRSVRSDDDSVIEVVAFGDSMPEDADANILLRARGVGTAEIVVNTAGYGSYRTSATVREPAQISWHFIPDSNSVCFQEQDEVLFVGQELIRGVTARDEDGTLMVLDGHPDLFPGTGLETLSSTLQHGEERFHRVHLKVKDQPGEHALRSIAPGIDGRVEIIAVDEIDAIRVQGAVEGVVSRWAGTHHYRRPIASSKGRESCVERVFRKDDYRVEEFTPQVCQISIPTFAQHPTFLSLPENGWSVGAVTNRFESGECHYTISIPSFLDGAGWSFEEKFFMEASVEKPGN